MPALAFVPTLGPPDQSLDVVDPEVAAAIGAGLARQQGTLEMIASENFAPPAVLAAQGSVLTNNFSCRLYRVVAYHVRCDDHRVDMGEVAVLAREHRPKLIIAGWPAYPRRHDFAAFRAVADEVGAYLLVDMAHFAGLVAAGLHPSLVPYAHVVTTTTHKTLGGPRGGVILSTAELATRGFDRDDFAEVADIIATALCHPDDETARDQLWARVGRLTAAHPLYPNPASLTGATR